MARGGDYSEIPTRPPPRPPISALSVALQLAAPPEEAETRGPCEGARTRQLERRRGIAGELQRRHSARDRPTVKHCTETDMFLIGRVRLG
jgi:hypothetical protein